MGFSGKPSKGCKPCREKRTKCDLRQPSCTQCIRKKRFCSGYRNETDMLFRNETNAVALKARRKAKEQSQPPEQRFAVQQPVLAQPSRLAALNDEATIYFFAHFNERFFSADSRHGEGGFDYILPVFQKDSTTGGPVPEIIRACGLAAIGNMRGAPGLLNLARQRQSQVFRQLNAQLRDPQTRTSDSSILTSIMLAIFENILCDSSSAGAMATHLQGASTLVNLRGPAQFNDDVSHGIFSRTRGFILAHCLQTRDPLPGFILTFLNDDAIAQRDFEPSFYKLLVRLCNVRASHKIQDFVDVEMAQEARLLMAEFEVWQPNFADWNPGERPTVNGDIRYHGGEQTYRFVWLATTWVFQQTAQIMASELVIEWAHAQVLLSPGSPKSRIFDDAVHTQIVLCDGLKESTEYYLKAFRDARSSIRTVGGYGLLWPLYVLSTSSTCTSETMIWIAKQAQSIAESFGIRQGQAMADFLWTCLRSSPLLG